MSGFGFTPSFQFYRALVKTGRKKHCYLFAYKLQIEAPTEHRCQPAPDASLINLHRRLRTKSSHLVNTRPSSSFLQRAAFASRGQMVEFSDTDPRKRKLYAECRRHSFAAGCRCRL